MVDCIFCKIVQGKVPCSKIHEDARVVSFLDINPINPGHALVIPKRHYPTLLEIEAEDLQACILMCQMVSRALMGATASAGFNLLQNNFRAAGQLVGHAHFHLIPRRAGDGFLTSWPAKSRTPADLDRVLEKVRANMKEGPEGAGLS